MNSQGLNALPKGMVVLDFSISHQVMGRLKANQHILVNVIFCRPNLQMGLNVLS